VHQSEQAAREQEAPQQQSNAGAVGLRKTGLLGSAAPAAPAAPATAVDSSPVEKAKAALAESKSRHGKHDSASKKKIDVSVCIYICVFIYV
jgi:hypothetical protein